MSDLNLSLCCNKTNRCQSFTTPKAASEIPNADLLWFADEQTRTAKSKSGVLEQIGRMLIQDRFSSSDCIYIATLAADAVSAGYTSREVENAIRAVRLAYKARGKHKDDPYYENTAYRAADTLRQMAGERSNDD